MSAGGADSGAGSGADSGAAGGRRYRLGVDIGGTFTDLTLVDEQDGRIEIFKTPSVPKHPSRAVVDGLHGITASGGVNPADIGTFIHGTTLALNTLLQRNGATCGLLVTRGFRDILELQRLRLPDPHTFDADKTTPLVRRKHVREVPERLLADGRVYLPLDEEALLLAARDLVDAGVEALTVCFLHAYRNDDHERRAKAILEGHFPTLYVSISSEIWPQQREYERALITVINSYVGAALASYFQALEEEVAREGLRCTLLSTRSNGGVMSVASARTMPVQTLLSGPASGVRGAMFVGALAGYRRLVTFDLGGTSADIAIVDGKLPYATDNRVAGFPMIMPVVDIASIGAGGGSIAWTDAQGVLKVGPRSAGADPGPAAYGRGGRDATLTDAYITVGLLDPDTFLGGSMPLRPELAERAIAPLAERLDLPVAAAAEAIVRVATANMYAELLPLMARRGVDPDAFALLPYGGAGPTHAFMLAREIGLPTVVVPLQPGTLCALGCLVADVQNDLVQTIHADLDKLDDDVIAERYRAMMRRGADWLALQDGRPEGRTHPDGRTRYRLGADMRYHGQSFETAVDLGDDEALTLEPGVTLKERLVEGFHRHYETIYGYADRGAAVELINLRLTVVGLTPKPSPAALAHAEAAPTPTGTRTIRLGVFSGEAAVYRRADLLAGHRLDGPAIVEQYDSTTFIPDGFQVLVDAYGTLIGTDRR